ncbi:MAG TPA: hypothetical protein VLF91_01325 [Candidatus Saccharimonadales bacterium]|nr:hypothetical protein [Candidatus Saccharimonadales bacterium]
MLGFAILAFIPVSSYAQAAPSNQSVANVGECGGQDTASAAFLRQTPPAGKLYIRLTNSAETSAPVTVYYQSIQDGVCRPLGTVTPNQTIWTAVGVYKPIDTSGVALVVNGVGLSAPPYAAAASLLIVPDPVVCTPDVTCAVRYQGYNATLVPRILTGATDAVAIYAAEPVVGATVKKVSYYADNTYLYDSKTFVPINRGYLRGGMHTVTIQVTLANGEVLIINQALNNGDDFAGTKYLRSLFYRSHNKTLFLAAIGLTALGLLLLLWTVRQLYKHHMYREEHGLEHYAAPKPPADDPNKDDNNNVIVG